MLGLGRRTSPASRLAELDDLARRRRAGGTRPAAPGRRDRLGRSVADLAARQGWTAPSVRADLALLERSPAEHWAAKVLLAGAAVVLTALLGGAAALAGLGGLAVLVPVWAALVAGLAGFVLPDARLRSAAAGRRRDFRTVAGSFLDLVAMRMAGGAGLAEALRTASQVGDGWAFRQIRAALADGRLQGWSSAESLERLGTRLALPDLADLGRQLDLVEDAGVGVRDTLRSRAASLRDRELADALGQANERSQSMLVAQALLAAGFMVFLGYPAVSRVFAS